MAIPKGHVQICRLLLMDLRVSSRALVVMELFRQRSVRTGPFVILHTPNARLAAENKS